MKAQEIRDLTGDEISVKLNELREEILRMRLRLQAGQLEKSDQIKKTRRVIARLETILRQKQATAA